MLDLHCHLLPGVDDGPKMLSESLELARVLSFMGTTHVICTPHCHRGLRMLRDDVVPRTQLLNQELQKAGIPLAAFPGSEVQLWNIEWVREKYQTGELCLLSEDKRFMLAEFPWNASLYPHDAAGFFRWLVAQGTQPIVAHPERHDFLRDYPDRIATLVDAGAWLQLTVGSFQGEFGPDAQESAHHLASTDYPIVLASDSHGMWRYSGIEEGLDIVSENAGAERAADIALRLMSVEKHLTELYATK